MGTSTSPKQFAGKIEKLGKLMNDPKVPLNATGLAGKRIFEAAAAGSGALGGRMQGKRKIIGARYDIGGGRKSSHGDDVVVITYTGPAHLVNNPTKPHRIEPRKARGNRSRRRGSSALVINGDVRMWANHPGTKGKDFYSRAKGACVNKLPSVYARAEITEPLKKVFG